MIIPGYAVLSLCSPAPELQGPKEEGSSFGQLLTEVEDQTICLPDQEGGERRALESLLQVLMAMFQSFTLAHPAPAVSAPRAGESGVVNIRSAGGPVLGLPCGFVPTPVLGEMREANLPSGLVTDVSPDIEPPTCPAAASQRLEPSSVTAILQESMPDVRELFLISPTVIMAERLADTGATADRVLRQVAASPGLPQIAIATTGEGDRLTPETAPQAQRSLVPAVEGNNPLPASALTGSQAPLIQRSQQPGGFSTPGIGHRRPVGLTQPDAAPAVAPEGVAPGPTEPLTRMTSYASPHVVPIKFPPTLEQAGSTTMPLLTGDEALQRPGVRSQLSSWVATTAASGMIHAAAPPLAEAFVSLQALPQTDATTRVEVDASGLRPMVIAEDKAAFPERDHAPSARRAPGSEEPALASMSSLSHLTADHAFASPLTGAMSHIPSVASDTPVPLPSYLLEDVLGTRQWPRPLPAHTVLLHLEPRELGALLVQVHVSEKRLIASFQAQSPEAEALLRTHLPALQDSLSQQGFEVQPIAITQAAEGFSMHLGTGTGAFAQQHSAFQAFTQNRHAAGTEDTQSEVEMNRIPRWPAEQRARLLDVVI